MTAFLVDLLERVDPVDPAQNPRRQFLLTCAILWTHLRGKWGPKIGPMGPGPLSHCFLLKMIENLMKWVENHRKFSTICQDRSGRAQGVNKNAFKSSDSRKIAKSSFLLFFYLSRLPIDRTCGLYVTNIKWPYVFSWLFRAVGDGDRTVRTVQCGVVWYGLREFVLTSVILAPGACRIQGMDSPG